MSQPRASTGEGIARASSFRLRPATHTAVGSKPRRLAYEVRAVGGARRLPPLLRGAVRPGVGQDDHEAGHGVRPHGLVRVAADQAALQIRPRVAPPVKPGSRRSSYGPESSGHMAMQETPSPVQPAASGGVEENYEPVLYSQTRWVLQADSNEYMHRNATKRDGQWPPSVLCRAVPSHTAAGSVRSATHPRGHAECGCRRLLRAWRAQRLPPSSVSAFSSMHSPT